MITDESCSSTKLTSTSKSRNCEPALHTALYTCQFLRAKRGPVNRLGRICSGAGPAVGSMAGFQNPEPTRWLLLRIHSLNITMSHSDPTKALIRPVSNHAEYKCTLCAVRKGQKEAGKSVCVNTDFQFSNIS